MLTLKRAFVSLFHSELSELQRLLDLISVCPSKQQLPSLEAEVETDSLKNRQRHHGSHHQSTEALSLEDFRLVMYHWLSTVKTRRFRKLAYVYFLNL